MTCAKLELMSKIYSFYLILVAFLFLLVPTSVLAKEIRPVLQFEAKIDKQFNNDFYKKRLGNVTAVVTIVNPGLQFKKWASSDSLGTSAEFPLEVGVPGSGDPCASWSECVKYGNILLSVEVDESFQVSRTNPIVFNVSLKRAGGADGTWQLTSSPAISNGIAQVGIEPARVELYMGSLTSLTADPNIPVTYTWTPKPITFSSPTITLNPDVLEKKAGENFTLNALINLGSTWADQYQGCYVNTGTNQSPLCQGANKIIFHIDQNKQLFTDQDGGVFSKVESFDPNSGLVSIPFTTESSGFGTYLFCMYLWDPLVKKYVSGTSDIYNCKPLIIKESLGNLTDDVQPSINPNSVDLSDIINSQAKITLTLAKHNRQNFMVKMTSYVATLVTKDLTMTGVPLDCSKVLLDTACQKEVEVKTGFDTTNPGLLEASTLNPNQIIIKDDQGKLRGTLNLTITDNNNKLAKIKEDLNNNLKNSVVAVENKCKDPNNKDCSKAEGIKCPDGSDGLVTAIGCIHTQPKALVQDFLRFATGIGGGLAFMMMLLGAFQMLTSGGNPQNLQGGREVFQNALIGLLFVIFSILIMKIIGIDILNIPGFSSP